MQGMCAPPGMAWQVGMKGLAVLSEMPEWVCGTTWRSVQASMSQAASRPFMGTSGQTVPRQRAVGEELPSTSCP